VVASQVSYFTGVPPAAASEAEPEGVRILRAPVYPALHKSFAHRLLVFLTFMVSSFWHSLAVKQVDVVWGSSPPIFQGLTAWALARLKGAKFLFEVRDLWPEFAIAVGVLKNPLLIRLSLALERFLYRRADLVIINSPGYLQHVTAGGARRVELVPNGADPQMFDPANRGLEFRRRNALADEFVVLYAGAHGLSNDLGIVLEAAGLLAGEPGIRLVLLGDGKEKPNLLKQAGAAGLKNVTFLPSVPKKEMSEALAAADACLAILKPIPAYKTTYPNKVFDYMAAGRPIVLAIDGVIRQVVEAAGCGLFAQPGDPLALAEAILSLARDRELARRMGLAGRKYLEKNFNREQVAAGLISLLERLVDGQPA
jgi:glycosyltransferase involved in cell wall biosynthesis